MNIGSHSLANNLVLAPMAGVTDRPFRQLCRRLGAGLTVSEMISANPALRLSKKTLHRSNHEGEPAPVVVQIAGADPEMMAAAARYNVDRGADVIDINMGCPAKKVCNQLAGSALMKDVNLIARILESVVKSVSVPVTLKIRTGWNEANRNAATVALLAQDIGIQALTIHGRTRACGFRGSAEHETTRHVKSLLSIPVVANGDIRTPMEARTVLKQTGADAIMIGRGAQGRPWIFRDISFYLRTGRLADPPDSEQFRQIVHGHLVALYEFYGEYTGLRHARKHIGWYFGDARVAKDLLARAIRTESCREQLEIVGDMVAGGNTRDLAA